MFPALYLWVLQIHLSTFIDNKHDWNETHESYTILLQIHHRNFSKSKHPTNGSRTPREVLIYLLPVLVGWPSDADRFAPSKDSAFANLKYYMRRGSNIEVSMRVHLSVGNRVFQRVRLFNPTYFRHGEFRGWKSRVLGLCVIAESVDFRVVSIRGEKMRNWCRMWERSKKESWKVVFVMAAL